MYLFKSASRVVLMIFALAMVAGLFTKVISGDQFMIIASGVFSYYYGSRTPQNTNAQ